MSENKNYRFDEERQTLFFKRCPRSFLKTDVPAKRLNKWCPFRTKLYGGFKRDDLCLLPSGLRYAEEKGADVWKVERICFKCKSQNPRESDK